MPSDLNLTEWKSISDNTKGTADAGWLTIDLGVETTPVSNPNHLPPELRGAQLTDEVLKEKGFALSSGLKNDQLRYFKNLSTGAEIVVRNGSVSAYRTPHGEVVNYHSNGVIWNILMHSGSLIYKNDDGSYTKTEADGSARREFTWDQPFKSDGNLNLAPELIPEKRVYLQTTNDNSLLRVDEVTAEKLIAAGFSKGNPQEGATSYKHPNGLEYVFLENEGFQRIMKNDFPVAYFLRDANGQVNRILLVSLVTGMVGKDTIEQVSPGSENWRVKSGQEEIGQLKNPTVKVGLDGSIGIDSEGTNRDSLAQLNRFNATRIDALYDELKVAIISDGASAEFVDQVADILRQNPKLREALSETNAAVRLVRNAYDLSLDSSILSQSRRGQIDRVIHNVPGYFSPVSNEIVLIEETVSPDDGMVRRPEATDRARLLSHETGHAVDQSRSTTGNILASNQPSFQKAYAASLLTARLNGRGELHELGYFLSRQAGLNDRLGLSGIGRHAIYRDGKVLPDHSSARSEAFAEVSSYNLLGQKYSAGYFPPAKVRLLPVVFSSVANELSMSIYGIDHNSTFVTAKTVSEDALRSIGFVKGEINQADSSTDYTNAKTTAAIKVRDGRIVKIRNSFGAETSIDYDANGRFSVSSNDRKFVLKPTRDLAIDAKGTVQIRPTELGRGELSRPERQMRTDMNIVRSPLAVGKDGIRVDDHLPVGQPQNKAVSDAELKQRSRPSVSRATGAVVGSSILMLELLNTHSNKSEASSLPTPRARFN